ncbi:hypothetical protein AB0V79_31795 [Mesorhizobium ciceri]|nr:MULTISPECIES: hypothetical protein [Mesorhizobium]
MRFSILLFGWAAFFGWDFAANDGQTIIGLGVRVARLFHLSGLI